VTDTLSRIIAIVRGELASHRPAHTLPEITAESSFERDLACDALDIISIELALEDEFCVIFPAERLEACETVGALAELVWSLISAEAA